MFAARALKLPSCVVPISSRALSNTSRTGTFWMRSLSHSTCRCHLSC